MPLPPISAPLICETRSIEIEQLTQSALGAYEAGETAAFHEAVGDLEERLTCLREPLSPDQAGQIHLLFGIANIRAFDDASAAGAFRAAYETSPDLRVAPGLLELDVLRAQLDQAARAARSARKPIVAPPNTRVLIDGAAATDRPTGRPYIVQLQWTTDDQVHFSGYMPASTFDLNLALYAPPEAPRACPSAAELCAPCPSCPEPRPPLSPALVTSAVAANTLAAGLAIAASWRYEIGVDTNQQKYLDQAAALGIGSATVGAVAIGLDVALLVRTYRDARESR